MAVLVPTATSPRGGGLTAKGAGVVCAGGGTGASAGQTCSDGLPGGGGGVALRGGGGGGGRGRGEQTECMSSPESWGVGKAEQNLVLKE